MRFNKCGTAGAVAAAATLSLILSACAHKPQPGEEITNCGPIYQIRAKPIQVPKTEPGVVTVEIATSDRYENIADIQVGLESPNGRFFVEKLPRTFAYTNSRGQLRVEWHPPQDSAGEPTLLRFQALDFPGDCSVELLVEPKF